MKGIAKLFLKQGDIHDLIPADSPWYWAWGLQGFHTVIIYKRLDRLLSSHAIPRLRQEIEAVEEDLAAARFSCRYGRTAPRNLRNFIEFMDEKHLIPHDKLRHLVQSGEIYLTKNNEIAVGQKPFLPLLGVTLVTVITLGLISLIHDILITDSSFEGKLIASLFVSIFFLYNIFEFYHITVKPFLLVLNVRDAIFIARKRFTSHSRKTLSIVT